MLRSTIRMWPADLTAQIASEFDHLSTYDPWSLSRPLGGSSQAVFGSDAGVTRRRSRKARARQPGMLERKAEALRALAAAESARSVAKRLGVNRATVCRWAREAGLVLRRNPWGHEAGGKRRRSSVDWAASSRS